MDDYISRQAAIDALMEKDKKLRNINWYDKPYAEVECRGIDEALSIISNLSSAQPERIPATDVTPVEILKVEIYKLKCQQDSKNQDYYTGYMSALSTVEGILAEMDGEE